MVKFGYDQPNDLRD